MQYFPSATCLFPLLDCPRPSLEREQAAASTSHHFLIIVVIVIIVIIVIIIIIVITLLEKMSRSFPAIDYDDRNQGQVC